jgi:primase-polymerase (primpol)-like protein
VNPNNVPHELQQLDQWINWIYGRDPKNPDKQTKKPVNPITGYVVNAHDPSNWTDFQTAVDCARRNRRGVGFVLTAYDPFVGVDLDNCIGDAGNLAPWADTSVKRLKSYSEVTPSGRGLRIFVRGTLPPAGRKRGNVEMYSEGRFLTVTGNHLPGTPTTVEERTAELAEIHLRIFGKCEPVTVAAARPAEPLTNDDEDLLRIMFRSSRGTKIQALWNGDTSGYPSQSEAVLALCSHLAYYTGGDAPRIDRLFQQSGLFYDHWTQKDGIFGTWGQRTIQRAMAGVRTFYSPTYRSVAAAGRG